MERLPIASLTNPAWHAMNSLQADISAGNARARRYRQDVSPFAGVAELSALPLLSELVPAGEAVALMLAAGQTAADAGWQVLMDIPIIQMVCHDPDYTGLPDQDVGVALGEADETDMLALARETDPGPFEIKTRLMGSYVGVRDDTGELVAMAGERMRLPGWTEISGVCTSEKARGRGYAKVLVAQLMRPTHAAGDKTFLHVRIGSPSEAAAIAAYERLGFEKHQEVLVQLIQRSQ